VPPLEPCLFTVNIYFLLLAFRAFVLHYLCNEHVSVCLCTAEIDVLFSLSASSLRHALAQLVEALRYEPEGRGFLSRWCHWNFSLTSFQPHYGPGIDSVSNRNEYQECIQRGKGGRCVGLTTLAPSLADCHEIWILKLLEPSACPDL